MYITHYDACRGRQQPDNCFYTVLCNLIFVYYLFTIRVEQRLQWMELLRNTSMKPTRMYISKAQTLKQNYMYLFNLIIRIVNSQLSLYFYFLCLIYYAGRFSSMEWATSDILLITWHGQNAIKDI